MAESFGARMRERREQQQISLVAIAEQTKIKLSLLDALERDDVSHWPTGIFRRAFIRAYAHAIDLEPDTVVKEFLELHPDPPESMVPVPAVEPGTRNGHSRPAPPMRLRFLVRSAMDSVARALTAKRPVPGERAAVSPPVVMPPLETPSPLQADASMSDNRPFDDVPAREIAPGRRPLDAAQMLARAAAQLEAIGLVVWTWDAASTELVPAYVHGYSDQIVAQLPAVRRDADNATAAAFRTMETCTVRSSAEANGALVVPLMTSSGCVGVFAVELPSGAEQHEPLRALTRSLAAEFADCISAPSLRHAVGV